MAASSASMPAPVGGLNDRDSITRMPAQDAVVLDNWFPYPSRLGIRKGCISWSTGYPAPVETIVDYSPASGSPKLFAIAGGNIYNATASGAVGAPVVTGLSNSRWQDVSITTPGGSFLYLFNGVDKPRHYNGSTNTWVAVDGASNPAITGVPSTTVLIHGTLYKNRIWMVENASMKAWYLPTNAIAGTASLFDLGSIFHRGGFLMAIYPWTLDAGAGSDDNLVFISSNGECAVYTGTNPANANTWSLMGVYFLGKPVGRRCGQKYAGDLLIITEDGVYPLSRALQSATINRSVAITDKIQNGISNAVVSYRQNYGWMITLFSEMNMIILNIPKGGGQSFQYIQNTITGAWATVSGWNANVWRATSAGLFFGNQNSVQMAWQGYADNGTQIIADAVSSFQSFGNSAQKKQFTMVKPYIQTSGTPSINYGLNTDYVISDVTGVFNYTAPSGMVWGTMVWGNAANMTWGGGLRTYTNWKSVGKWARAATLRLKIQANNSEVYWQATDYLYERGGVL